MRPCAGLGSRQRDVGDPFEVQSQHQELHELRDQRVHRVRKVHSIREERVQHADRQCAREHLVRADEDEQHVFDTQQHTVRGVVGEIQARDACTGVGRLDELILPRPFALGFLAEQFDSLKGADRFEKMRVEARVGDDAFVAAPAQRLKEQQPHRCIDRKCRDGDAGKQRRIDEQHDQRRHRHQAVDDGRDDATADELLNRLQRAETRHDVADVAALKIIERQADQVREQPHADRIAQLVREVQPRVAAHGFCRDVDQREHQKADGQNDQHVDVVFDEHVVDDQLHVRRRRQRKQLDQRRQHQQLDKGAGADAAPEGREAQARRARRTLERGCRREFERNAGEMARQFVQRIAPLADRRVVDRCVTRTDALQHDEMIEVPMQNRGTRQALQFVDVDAQRPRAQARLLRRRRSAAAATTRAPTPRVRGGAIARRRDCRDTPRPSRGTRDRTRTPRSATTPAGAGGSASTGIARVVMSRPRSASSGSISHSRIVRCSSTMSALNAMPDCSGTSRWPAATDWLSSATVAG